MNPCSFFVSHRLPIALAARDAGYDVFMCAPPDHSSSSLAQHGIRFLPLQFDRRSTNPLVAAQAVQAFVRTYREVRPDIVHHVSLKAILYGTLAARLTGVPAVFNAVAGLGYLFNNRTLRDAAVRELASAVLRVSLAHPNTTFVFQNPDDREIFLRRHIATAERSVLIRGSGVDLARFAPRPAPEGPPVVMFASRMLWNKGVGEFVEAARMLRGVAGARFVLVGDSDAGNPGTVPPEQLRQWADEGVVEWWGHRSDMHAVFDEASLVVFPSYYGEGVPKVLLEAAASGRAIVTTDEPGCREAVTDGDNGLLVPARDAASLTRAVRRLLDDPAERRRMGVRGRERALAEFDVKDVVARTVSLYQRALGRSDAQGLEAAHARR